MQPRSNLSRHALSEHSLQRHLCRDVGTTSNAGSTTGGSGQLPYNCSTSGAELNQTSINLRTNGCSCNQSGERSHGRLGAFVGVTLDPPSKSVLSQHIGTAKLELNFGQRPKRRIRRPTKHSKPQYERRTTNRPSNFANRTNSGERPQHSPNKHFLAP